MKKTQERREIEVVNFWYSCYRETYSNLGWEGKGLQMFLI
jgi:hypothetical protein